VGNKANFGRDIFADLGSCPSCSGVSTQDVLEWPFLIYDDDNDESAVTSFDQSLGTVSNYSMNSH